MRFLPYVLVWLAVLACLVFGSWASMSAPSFYVEVERPSWSPPGWVFGPVWTILYVLIAFAGCRLWQERARCCGTLLLWLYGLQLCANLMWSFFFFKWRMGAAAFVDLVLLDLLVLAIIVIAWKNGARLVSILMIPYLLWVIFASCLAFAVWQLNLDVL